MSLVEVARFADVYEADLAAAFLRSHDIEVSVTERFQTTVDPLMQRALGVRLMTPAGVADEARDLLARAQAGEFAAIDEDPVGDRHPAPGIGLAVLSGLVGGFPGTSRPRRLRVVHWIGLAILATLAGMLLLARLASGFGVTPEGGP